MLWKMSSSKRPSTATECNPSKRRKLKEELKFCTLKCKLKRITKSSNVLSRVKDEVVLAHEVFKRALFFMRLFFLEKGEVPLINLSLVKECMNRVSMRESRGAKLKDTGMGEELDRFWKKSFNEIYPDLLDFKGRSMMKQLLAQEILSNILVDTKTHFKSRFRTFLESLLRDGDSNGNPKSEACKLTGQVFANHWNDVPIDLKRKLRDILPADVEKSVAYDVMKNPEKYLNATLSMCREMERVQNVKKKIHFLPTRTSNVPCHAKFDTETMAQMFVPYKERVEARKSALHREDYNDWV